MANSKERIKVEGPILNGSLGETFTRCGKSNCACARRGAPGHRTGMRWTGIIAGERKTKTLSPAEVRKVRAMIARYSKVQRQVASLIEEGLKAVEQLAEVRKRRSK